MMMSYLHRGICLSLLSAVVSEAELSTPPEDKASSNTIFKFQFFGTRKSYRNNPTPSLPEWDFENPSIEDQLNAGARWLEFEIPDWTTRSVSHIDHYDNDSKCKNLWECL